MNFDRPLLQGRAIRRRNRFVVDVRLPDGTEVAAHCANTGSMRTCLAPGWRVALSAPSNPKRTLGFTLEMTHNGHGWIGVNTHLPNHIVAEALAQGRVPELAGYTSIERERTYGNHSRIDLLLTRGTERCYVEIKNTTLLTDDDCIAFPDAVTSRGLKHLRELTQVAQSGQRAVMFYLVQRADGQRFRPAVEIDKVYGAAFEEARSRGVETLVYRADVSPAGVTLGAPLAQA